MLRDQVEVGAAGGNDEGLAQLLGDEAGSDTVGIVVVGIDQVEVEPVS